MKVKSLRGKKYSVILPLKPLSKIKALNEEEYIYLAEDTKSVVEFYKKYKDNIAKLQNEQFEIYKKYKREHYLEKYGIWYKKSLTTGSLAIVSEID